MENLSIESEELTTFRNMFDLSLRNMMVNMKEKDMQNGTITGKIKIQMERVLNRDTGELMTVIHMKPDVSIKLGINGKVECEKINGLHLAFDRNGNPVISENQISMDELLGKGA